MTTLILTPEQVAIAKGAAFERNRGERGRMLRGLERSMNEAAAQAAPEPMPADVRDLSAREYALFKRRVRRSLAGRG
jgi:hypothetical protein